MKSGSCWAKRAGSTPQRRTSHDFISFVPEVHHEAHVTHQSDYPALFLMPNNHLQALGELEVFF